jgi:hypothetical protein
MELNDKTLAVLKNYATINPNVVINEGNVLKTISEAKNVLSSAELDDTFPKTFGIYDLNEFLNVLSLVDSPNLKFEDNYVLVSDGSGRTRIKYFYSDIDMLTVPSKDIIMPEAEVSFSFDRETLSRVKRAASVLGHTELSVSVINNVLSLSVVDQNENFNYVFNISNLKMIDDDYRVDISSKLISHFVNEQSGIQYWVALEKTSTYGE